MRGNENNDLLDGFSDNDELFGDEDDDTLVGSNGEDTLIGGAGNDLLIGESDEEFSLALPNDNDGREDIFKFALKTETSPDPLDSFGNDVILDFGNGRRDKIEFDFKIIAENSSLPDIAIINFDVLDSNGDGSVGNDDALVTINGGSLIITLPDAGDIINFDGPRTISYSFGADGSMPIEFFEKSTITFENIGNFDSLRVNDFIFVGDPF